jgi:3-oxoacid CoA-transferase subunit A
MITIVRAFDRIFVRGDTHGDFDFLPDFCRENNTSTRDLLIILGDAGINYYGPTQKKEMRLKSFLREQPINIFCVRGNHEDRPEDRPEYSLKDVGIRDEVYTNEWMPNVWFAKDGGEYQLNNYSCLVVGGAYSVDKFYRISNGWKWVANEMLDGEEIAGILDICYHKHYDHIFTHTCPLEWQPTDLFLRGLDQNTIPKNMEMALSQVAHYCEYDHWWFGHFHANRMDCIGDGKVHMLFEDIVEITNGVSCQ